MLIKSPRIVSHFRQKTLLSVTALALLAGAGPAVTAQAANAAIDYPGLKTPMGQIQTRTVSLSDFTSPSGKPVLDWRTPTYSLKFDVPDMDWTSSLQLTLSMDPVGTVSPDADIYVQFNQAAPVKVVTKGRGFDARLSLEAARVRPRGNILRVMYQAPAQAECLRPQDGAWALNLVASKLTRRHQAKSRQLNVSDIEAALSNPLNAPEEVSLVATGPSATQLQSLLAQAVGQRMEKTPDFTTRANASKVEIIAGRRDQISQFVKNEDVMMAEGPRLVLDEGRPLRVILTGDTDEQVLGLVQAFANYRLPDTRRTMVSTGELRMQRLLSEDMRLTSGRTTLAGLGSNAFAPGWNPGDLTLHFDVDDPLASQGDVLLRLAAPEAALGKKNTLTLSLNDQPLGQTQLDKTRKSVAFPVPQGTLQGQDNVLKMSAYLDSETVNGCKAQSYAPNSLYFEKGSRITLNQEGETPLSDLSRLTASGAPFSDAEGENTLLVLPKNTSDYQAALRLLAKLAKTSGGGWSDALFTRDGENVETLTKDRNLLLILPANEIPDTAKSNAPKSFLSALRGTAQDGDNLLTAETDRYASAETLSIERDFAARTAQRNHISRGGVAALYASPYQSNKMMGVITHAPGESFSQALEALSKPGHWNALEGQVARWDNDSVLMTELSSKLPGFERIKPTSLASGFKLPEIDLSGINLSRVDLSKPVFTLPQIHLPGLDLPKSNFEIKAKFVTLKNQVKSTSSHWHANMKRASLPGHNFIGWSRHKISAVLFLLALLFGGLIIYLGLSAPRNRNRNGKRY